MNAILFYLGLPFLLFLSILPIRVIYLLSDLLYPLVYYVIGYRRKVAMENLRNAFPEKTVEERQEIARKFYRHFTDVILEIVKMRTIPPASLSGRMRYSNPELLQEYYDQGKGVIAMTAHFNNWEWACGVSEWGPHHSVVVYKPLNNRHFDRYMKKTRERHGVEIITMRETLRRVVKDQQEGNLVAYGLISDQSPVWEETQYWTRFLNQDTAVYTGAEKLALRTGMPVVYYSIRKIRRGRYIIDMIPLSEDLSGKQEHEITDRFFQTLESKIRENPEYWLWTHRRWKLTARKLAEIDNS
jgi:KDO2-lipid IV(A) lauroyltransferase